MQISIEQKIFTAYPNVNVGLCIVRGANNQGENAELKAQLRAAEKQAWAKIAALDLPSLPAVRSFRQAFKKMSAKNYRSSNEALLRRVKKEDPLPYINSLVCLYNLVSLATFLPVGGEDLAAVQGNPLLTIASGGEEFYNIGATESNPAKAGEVIWRDDAGVLCRRWCWQEADRTKLTASTTDALLVIDGVGEITKEEVANGLEKLAQLVNQYVGGTVQTAIINQEQPLFTE